MTYPSLEYHFSSPAPPKVLPHYTPLSIVIGLVFAILLLRSFCTFDLRTLVIIVGLTLSYFIIYRVGEIGGVAQMKSIGFVHERHG